MFDFAIYAIGSIAALGALMWVLTLWCDLVVWAIDAICDSWDRVQHGHN